MNKIIYLGALLPLLAITAPSAFAHGSAEQRWNEGYSIGFYWTGSPANACDHHTHVWCDGYNTGYARGHTSSIYYASEQSQSSAVSIKGDNNDVVVNQAQASNTGGSDGGTFKGDNPRCVLLCGSVNVR